MTNKPREKEVKNLDQFQNGVLSDEDRGYNQALKDSDAYWENKLQEQREDIVSKYTAKLEKQRERIEEIKKVYDKYNIGYLQMSKKTAEKFINEAFTAIKQALLEGE